MRHLEDRKAITLDPFTITPFLVDHSAYDAYAILVEADGKRLFYSGDLRAHGRKGALFQKFLRQPPDRVDVLLMEGTTIGRDDQAFPTEEALEKRFVELFQQTKGMALVCCSGQNIDRIVTVVRACNKTGASSSSTCTRPRSCGRLATNDCHRRGGIGIKVFLPRLSRKSRSSGRVNFELANSYRSWRIFPEHLAQAAPTSVMLFRPSMMEDVERASLLGMAPDSSTHFGQVI